MMLKCKTSDEKTGLAHSGRGRAVDSTSQAKARLTWASIVRCPGQVCTAAKNRCSERSPFCAPACNPGDSLRRILILTLFSI
eukprot:scaffold5558_cov241-Pinguiococcus_pyrenoidosus.AAC.4